MNTRDARLFRAGDYPDKGFAATTADLDRMITATRQRGRTPFIPVHDDELLELGELDLGSLRREGEWVLGQIHMPAEIDRRRRTSGLSVGIDRDTLAITEVSLTPRSRVPGAALMERESGALVFHGGQLMPEEAKTESEAQTTSGGGASVEGGAEGVEAVVDAAVKRGLRGMFSRLLGRDDAPAAFSADDVEAIVARATAPLETKLAELTAQAETQRAEFERVTGATQAQRMAERVEREVQLGCRPRQAEILVQLLHGAETITFAQPKADGSPEEVQLERTAAIEELLTAERGTVRFRPTLPFSDSRPADGDDTDARAERARAIFSDAQAAGRAIRMDEAQAAADAEARQAGGV